MEKGKRVFSLVFLDHHTGTRPSLAQVSLARKIAATALSVWKNRTDFDAQRLAA